ncbi:uncharacterized protein TOL2_C33620 [Desulfobacula toluolica Tol2]|uniref:Uncharacterized protein n=3 Tax=Desulfobacula toluolica TaxID=28223 RepID=K0NB77_DESTT|nr:hypothetical protein [Desulfobacula toluolica]CCK81519.1 uncharacterized protein TOL2_C33620 [Desulfobacula toluolica Tol2]
MKKNIIVKTDDPEKKKFNLVVTGPVEKVVDINPRSVYMNGNSGDTLETVVNITPSEKYHFSILGMEQKIRNGIQARLIEPKSSSILSSIWHSFLIKTRLIEPKEDKKLWQIKIKSTSDTAANLYEILTLKTDSQYKPMLTIRINAVFHEKQKPSS